MKGRGQLVDGEKLVRSAALVEQDALVVQGVEQVGDFPGLDADHLRHHHHVGLAEDLLLSRLGHSLKLGQESLR